MIHETVPLLLALYQKITLSRSSTQPSKQILPDVSYDKLQQTNKLSEMFVLCIIGAHRVQSVHSRV